MSIMHSPLIFLPAALTALTVALPAPADADSDTCISGYVWREARPTDHTCVTPAVRTRTKQENANPTNHRSPDGGAYGPDTCLNGFVWREAFDGDTICVTSNERAETLADNAAAASRIQGTAPANAGGPPGSSHVVFEIYSLDQGVSVKDIDLPAANRRWVDEPLPWSYELDISPQTTSLSVRASGNSSHRINCRITVDGVVAHGPHDVENSAALTLCAWNR